MGRGGLRIYGLLCLSSGGGWDGRVCGVEVRCVCLPDCGWDGHVWVCFFPVVERVDIFKVMLGLVTVPTG